jgi:hypothetical protein
MALHVRLRGGKKYNPGKDIRRTVDSFFEGLKPPIQPAHERRRNEFPYLGPIL